MCMSRKVKGSKWRDGGHRIRRSPRISALDAWKPAHQPTTTSTFCSKKCKLGVEAMEEEAHQYSEEEEYHHHHHQGRPPSHTRARIKRKLHQLDIGSQNHEHRSPNRDQPLAAKVKGGAKLDDHATSTGQPSIASPIPIMPEKRILELVLDILQRRDTYEIFAEPVDPKEVDDYYEIIKEPMDFGTMRAKLHEGLYKNLEQFEHDALLIPRNAMHFNSTATIYFRQARAIFELAKNVFHVLKTDPKNIELEFSGTRRRSSRRLHREGRGLNFNSFPRIATKVRSCSITTDVSSKGTRHSLNGPSNLRRIWGNPRFSRTAACFDKRDYEFCPGARDRRRCNYVEADRRCTYRQLTSFHSENDPVVSTICSEPKSLASMNQGDISYRESLMLFVKDLGPIAQKIANRKLQGCSSDIPNFQTPASNCWGQASTCQVPVAFASAQKGPNILDFFDDPLHQRCSILKTTTDIIDLTGVDRGAMNAALQGKVATNNERDGMSNRSALKGKVATNKGNRMGNHSGFWGKVGSNNEESTSCECDWMKILSVSDNDEIHGKEINMIHPGLYTSTSGTEELSSLAIRGNDIGKKSVAAIAESYKMDNQEQQSILASDTSCSNESELKLRTNNISTSSSWPWHTSAVSSLSGSKYEPAGGPKGGGMHNSLSSSQTSYSVESNGLMSSAAASPFAFDLPFLKSRLHQMNHSPQNGFLQPRSHEVSVEEGPSSGPNELQEEYPTKQY